MEKIIGVITDKIFQIFQSNHLSVIWTAGWTHICFILFGILSSGLTGIYHERIVNVFTREIFSMDLKSISLRFYGYQCYLVYHTQDLTEYYLNWIIDSIFPREIIKIKCEHDLYLGTVGWSRSIFSLWNAFLFLRWC